MKKLLLLIIIPFLCFGQIDYESQIQPILNAQCIGCHQGDATYSGGLNLTSYDDLMDGGYTQGGVVTTGLLEDYITTGYMPAYGSGNSLYETEINLIIQWISEGANYIENCNSDIDNDGICEDHCEEWSMTVIVDCECSFFNANTYTVFFDTVYEESCELWEDCYCECINDLNENGICDEDEEAVVIKEFFNNKKLMKTIDALGRETTNKKGLQLHIYDDGFVEKKYLIK
tara:strand:- start:24 stop:713 length:690 start_codon:yes stop_codon:yes gene_type:complete